MLTCYKKLGVIGIGLYQKHLPNSHGDNRPLAVLQPSIPQ